MRIPGNFIPPSTFTRLGNTSLILALQTVSLVALAILVVKFAFPVAKQFYARLFHPSPAPIANPLPAPIIKPLHPLLDNPVTLLITNSVSAPLGNQNPIPIPIANSDLAPVANPISNPLAKPGYIQNTSLPLVDDKLENNAILRAPVQLPVVPQITMTDVYNHLKAEENKLSPLQLEKLNTIDSLRFQSLGSLAILNENLLRFICRIAGPVSFQVSRETRNIATRLKNEFEFSKGRAEKQFCKAIVSGDYPRSLHLIKEMQANWGENFEHHFLQLNFDLSDLLLFSNLIEFSNEASTPPTIRSLLHFKMIEIPFKRLNSDFIYRNILVLCQANHHEEVKTLLFKMFVEIRLFEPFPWGLNPSPINYEELPISFLSAWMKNFIEKMNLYDSSNVKYLFEALLVALKSEFCSSYGPMTDKNSKILSYEDIKQAAANSFTPALLKIAPISCKYFIKLDPSSNSYPQEVCSVDQLKKQRLDFEANIGKQAREKIKSNRIKRLGEDPLLWEQLHRDFENKQLHSIVEKIRLIDDRLKNL